MKVKTITIAVALFAVSAPAQAADSAPLRLYLPRDVVLEADSLTLGAIAILRSDDAELARRASAVPMGRAPFAKESLVIDRRTILSRLASCGIRAESVQITGAPKVTVRRNETVIRAAEILKTAEKFLRGCRPGPSGVGWRLASKVDDFVFAAAASKAKLQAKLAKNAPADHVKVRVTAVCGGKEVAAGDLLFKLLHPDRQAVAVRDIPAGTKVTAENTKIQAITRQSPARKEFVSPLGSIAAVEIKAGKVIHPNAVRQEKPAVVVERGRTVVMKIEGPGFRISGFAEALQDGRPGEIIKVRNVDTKRIVTARVAFDGTVSPVLREVSK